MKEVKYCDECVNLHYKRPTIAKHLWKKQYHLCKKHYTELRNQKKEVISAS